MNSKIPRIGVGVIVIKDKKILLGKRKGSLGEGTWGFVGGHLEFGETVLECAQREVLEETGIKIDNLRHGPWTEDIYILGDKHYLTIFVLADYKSGNVTINEPDVCDQWEWFEWKDLPEPLFLPVQNLIKSNFKPF